MSQDWGSTRGDFATPLLCGYDTDQDVVELNVGGRFYTTTPATLQKYADSTLGQLFKSDTVTVRDSTSRFFIDRDGELFVYVLDFLRSGKLNAPAGFAEYRRLKQEAEYYKLPELLVEIETGQRKASERDQWKPGNYITLTEHATFAVRHHDRVEGAHFRTGERIIVAGHVGTCTEVFGDTLCFDRDTHTEKNRYTSRLYLTHFHAERAFLQLREKGFELVANSCTETASRNKMVKPETDQEKWMHVLTHIFCRTEPENASN